MKKSDAIPSQIDYSVPAEDFFFIPGRDEGLWSVGDIDWYWRPSQRAKVAAFAVSKIDDHNRRVNDVVDGYTNRRAFSSAIEFNTIPVVVDNFKVVRNLAGIGSKWLMSGAGGARIRNRYIWEHSENGYENEAKIVSYFDSVQTSDDLKPIEPFAGDIADLPFVIEARNLQNYFHFLTETLPRLQVAVDIKHTGPIVIAYHKTAIGGFVMDFINALFPEIAKQVELRPAPFQTDRAITTLTFDHYYFQTPDTIVPGFDEYAPRSWIWQGRRATRGSFLTFELNRLHDIQCSLRQRALDAIEDMDTSHLPKRFWVERSSGGAREREMKNEKKLVDQLKMIGFEVIRFEDFSPLEQIALMANAEVMASHHGAGFANMLFAGPQTHVIEIGTPQTASARWSDFIPLAHVSGCHYVAFFADLNWATPEKEPQYGIDGLIPVAVHDNSIKTITRYLRGLVGEFATNANKNEVLMTARHLRRSKSFRALRTYLDAFPKYVQADATLLQIYAKACDETDDPHTTFDALTALWEMDHTRFQTLEWMIWLTKRLKRPDLSHILVEEHAAKFPDRHAAFLGKIRWYQRMKSG